jgi:putative oxidoreductase
LRRGVPICHEDGGDVAHGRITLEKFFDRLTAWRPQLLSTLRIVTALLFLEHATQKLIHFPAMPMREGAPPPQGGFSAFMLIGILELVGSLALIGGYYTRLAAFVLSGEMAIAYWTAHVPRGGFFPLLNFGEAAVLFCFIFLYIAAAGPGPWSIDAQQGRK